MWLGQPNKAITCNSCSKFHWLGKLNTLDKGSPAMTSRSCTKVLTPSPSSKQLSCLISKQFHKLALAASIPHFKKCWGFLMWACNRKPHLFRKWTLKASHRLDLTTDYSELKHGSLTGKHSLPRQKKDFSVLPVKTLRKSKKPVLSLTSSVHFRGEKNSICA